MSSSYFGNNNNGANCNGIDSESTESCCKEIFASEIKYDGIHLYSIWRVTYTECWENSEHFRRMRRMHIGQHTHTRARAHRNDAIIH